MPPKFTLLSRNETEHTRTRSTDRFIQPRNLDPDLHPFSTEREYIRATRFAKLQRHFAKPLLGSLEGHGDTVTCLGLGKRMLTSLASGSADGELRVWDLASKLPIWVAKDAHQGGFIRGLSITPGDVIITCGDDKCVRLWDLNEGMLLGSHVGNMIYMGCDAHWSLDEYVTCGETVQTWNVERPNEPITTFSWGSDTINAVKYNPAEPTLMASVGGSDRSVVLYDTRQQVPLSKLIQTQRNNQLCWNPIEPMNFTTANEDSNLYTFDMRKMDHALHIHKDHVSAVMDVYYSPTGREFVSASYDKTIRIFTLRSSGNSREVYYTQRMQRVFCVRFTQDARFILSGSDDFNIRIWKARASKPLGVLTVRQRRSIEYADRLVSRFKHLPEVRRISQHRNLPKLVYKLKKTKHEQEQKDRRIRQRVSKHSRQGAVEMVPAREQSILKIEE
jgi:WD repeat and SOF domain-containing protein 1